jgi:hypothetical protein
MKHIALLACAGLLVSSAIAQMQTGTVVVVYLTQEKVIMAADSRTVFDDNRPPNDSKCKIVALDGKVIFGSSGLMDFTTISPRLSLQWSNTEEARKAYASTVGSPTGKRIAAVANQWGQAIALNFQSLYFFYPQEITKRLRDNDILTQAYFAGIENGEPVLYWTTVSFGGILITPQVRKITCPLQHFCAIGRTAISTEFTGLTSQRAKGEAVSWKPSPKADLADYDLLRTIRLVDLTIAYRWERDVGGPIDAVQLNRDGSLRWFQRKDNCPAN